jgi:lipopolysaccharide transport system permease protein
MLNPLSWFIEAARGVMLYGKVPDLLFLFGYFTFSLLVCFFGFVIFQKMRHLFADIV